MNLKLQQKVEKMRNFFYDDAQTFFIVISIKFVPYMVIHIPPNVAELLRCLVAKLILYFRLAPLLILLLRYTA